MILALAPAQASKAVSAMNVLLIEDDPDDRRLVADYLSEAGPEVFSIESADRLSTGLNRLSVESIDVVLLDLFLPDSEGLETFVRTHSHSPRVPIVIITGLDNEELATRAVRDGAQDYLRKENLSAEVLIRALRYASERKKSEERLRQAQKMEAIGRLAGGVAHDFNNLLGVILGNSEILQSCALRGDVTSHAVERIIQAAKSAASLTAQLLAYSRSQTLRPVVLNANEAVAKAEQLLRHLLRESIALVIRTDPELGHVRADPVQIEQVILNLAINARDAMPQGGTLTIETQNKDLDGGYSTSSDPFKAGQYVMLAVSDTGIGMDAHVQEHIFEPFYTTKVIGTGLGLATVHGIIEQSGGHIFVDSEPGRGTTIKVLLPRVKEQAESSKSSTFPGGSRQGTETILLVEDNDSLREVGREFLVGNGYTVLEAGSRDDALAVARKHPGPIHLLMTDVVLPCGSGREVAAGLKSLRPEMAVVYMSGYTDNIVAHHGVLDPGIVLLQKPFTRNQLLSFVREALDAQKAKTARGTG